MAKLAAIDAQVRSVCDLLHQYEGFERRQLRRIQKVGFYSAFAGSVLNGHVPQLSGYAFGFVHFRSIKGTDVPSILPVSLKVVVKRSLRAFVGHRTAIGLAKPYFYFNYSDKRTVQIGSKREKITTASDLAGMLYMPYREYHVLLREFAVRLPLFLCDRRFAKLAWARRW
jgi:hypothetical protein